MCKAEAPDVGQFARTHENDLDLIGLGTQDDLDLARTFQSTFDLPFPMLWDPSFASWQELGIRGQPAAVLFDRDGTLLDSWSGRIPEERVLELIGAIGPTG